MSRYDVDTLRLKKSKVANLTDTVIKRHRLWHSYQIELLSVYKFFCRLHEEDPIWLNDDIFVGDLPDCSTHQMVQALNGA